MLGIRVTRKFLKTNWRVFVGTGIKAYVLNLGTCRRLYISYLPIKILPISRLFLRILTDGVRFSIGECGILLHYSFRGIHRRIMKDTKSKKSRSLKYGKLYSSFSTMQHYLLSNNFFSYSNFGNNNTIWQISFTIS